MDFATIAGTIATLIFTEAVKKQGEALGQTVSSKIAQLKTAIREKFKAVGREGVMTDAEEEPNEENQSEFTSVLAKQMTKDEAFAKKLEELVNQIKTEGKNNPGSGIYQQIEVTAVKDVQASGSSSVTFGSITQTDIGNTTHNS